MPARERTKQQCNAPPYATIRASNNDHATIELSRVFVVLSVGRYIIEREWLELVLLSRCSVLPLERRLPAFPVVFWDSVDHDV